MRDRFPSEWAGFKVVVIDADDPNPALDRGSIVECVEPIAGDVGNGHPSGQIGVRPIFHDKMLHGVTVHPVHGYPALGILWRFLLPLTPAAQQVWDYAREMDTEEWP